MERDKEKECLRRMRQFLQEKWRAQDVSGNVVVHRHELDGIAVSVDLDRQRAWELFKASKGSFWLGEYLPESRSEERGYTAVRLSRVLP